jgi:hypothetical protein
MKRNTKSLLEELEYLSRTSDTRHIIENRANNLIASAIHLLEVIERNYDPERAAVLEKKLLVAIKNRDSSKFSRSLKRSDEQNEDK